MTLFILLLVALFTIGLFNPSLSLFWYKDAKTRGRSAAIYGALIILFVLLKSTDNHEVPEAPLKTISAASPVGSVPEQQSVTENTKTTEEEKILLKLKSKAKADWPNDYTTQEYWINQEMEDYRYMLTIPEGPIKRQAEHDWPYDYSTQKYWYNEQIQAKERLENN